MNESEINKQEQKKTEQSIDEKRSDVNRQQDDADEVFQSFLAARDDHPEQC